jgi:hypothetical protein
MYVYYYDENSKLLLVFQHAGDETLPRVGDSLHLLHAYVEGESLWRVERVTWRYLVKPYDGTVRAIVPTYSLAEGCHQCRSVHIVLSEETSP